MCRRAGEGARLVAKLAEQLVLVAVRDPLTRELMAAWLAYSPPVEQLKLPVDATTEARPDAGT